MTRIFRILQGFMLDTTGGAAISALLVCSLSGVFLAIPYNIKDPFDSIGLMVLDNPAANYIRNIHFWSAQAFLIFTILHMVDHFIQKTEKNPSRGAWWRLTLSVPVMFFVMISGFILKGDADALSAFRILSNLIGKIPLAGNLLVITFLGKEESLDLVYVHHIATATIILFIVVYEHSRKIWPAPAGFVITLLTILLISYFFRAPLGGDTGKGPWYFIGFQEVLHWFSRPGWAWLFLLAPVLMIGLVPVSNTSWNSRLKNFLVVFLAFYALATVAGTYFRGDNWKWIWPWQEGRSSGRSSFFQPVVTLTAEDFGYMEAIPIINGQREGCLVCHSNVTGFTASHDPAAIGCYSCHRGDPLTLNKSAAHSGMELIPGNLSNAMQSCGNVSCHPDIPLRVMNSIMTTMSGVITVDRFVFGETGSPDGLAHVREVGHTPADQHLRDLCVNCHLGNPKTQYGQITRLSRGGGCNACHLNYNDSSLVSLEESEIRLNSGIFHHPRLSIDISDDHCFGCHSRSGRIALSYAGWNETLYPEDQTGKDGRLRVLDDRRVVEFIGEDVHHKAGLTCTDCHPAVELMGDGRLYGHKEQQVKIRCGDCHFTGEPARIGYDMLDNESKKLVSLRNRMPHDSSFVIGPVCNLPLINLQVNGRRLAELRAKAGDTIWALRSPAAQCSQGKAHKSLSCEGCHTAWVPQCLGCHNSFDHDARGYDMLENKFKRGSWVEHAGLFLSDLPALGIVIQEDGAKSVKTFTPGMVLSIDTASFGSGTQGNKTLFRRLYAPISAHTTIKEGRSCKSCHLDPLAIGYGRGELTYEILDGRGKWFFRSRFALNPNDQLPEDAWIGFLEEPRGILATRSNARPFNLEEQRTILTVGACLACHPENSKVMKETLEDFEGMMKKISDRCVLPQWE